MINIIKGNLEMIKLMEKANLLIKMGK